MDYESNEDLLRDGECPRPNCILEDGHEGMCLPGTGVGTADYQAQARKVHGLPSTLIREGETAWEASRRMRKERGES